MVKEASGWAKLLAEKIGYQIPYGMRLDIVMSALAQVAGDTIAYTTNGNIDEAMKFAAEFNRDVEQWTFQACYELSEKKRGEEPN